MINPSTQRWRLSILGGVLLAATACGGAAATASRGSANASPTTTPTTSAGPTTTTAAARSITTPAPACDDRPADDIAAVRAQRCRLFGTTDEAKITAQVARKYGQALSEASIVDNSVPDMPLAGTSEWAGKFCTYLGGTVVSVPHSAGAGHDICGIRAGVNVNLQAQGEAWFQRHPASPPPEYGTGWPGCDAAYASDPMPLPATYSLCHKGSG